MKSSTVLFAVCLLSASFTIGCGFTVTKKIPIPAPPKKNPVAAKAKSPAKKATDGKPAAKVVQQAAIVGKNTGDWPQWRGPDRTGISNEKGLLQSWPKNGPPLVWTYDNAGLGFSSPSIVGNRLYTMGARDEKTYLFCLDISEKTPKELWSYELGPIFTFDVNTWGDGPRSSPTVDGDRVYALSGWGHLVCVSTAGKLIWRKHLADDFGGVMMTYWGYSESVLVDGDKLICTPGGQKGTLLALNKKTGETLWQSKEITDKATYASVMPATIRGLHQYVVLTYVSDAEGAAIAGVSSKDGKVSWYHHPGNFAKSSYSVATTPIIKGDEVYVASGYGAGCRLLEITGDPLKLQVKELYGRKQKKVMKNSHGGVVLIGDYLYGHSENDTWVCQNWKTGREKWYDRQKLPCSSGAMIAAGDRLYLFSDEGTAVLLEANPKGWAEHGRFNIPKKSQTPQTRATSRSSRLWTHPVIANGRLYLRDQEYLFCFNIRENK